MLTRRQLIQNSAWAAASAVLVRRGFAGPASTQVTSTTPIDRQAVVARHKVRRNRTDPRSPLQVGNGTIAFGTDVTGLQTFAPFNTLSQWAWYTAPLPMGETLADMADVTYPAPNREIQYDSGDPKHPELKAWAFGNPSRINLARIGVKLTRADGELATEKDLTDVNQELDLWAGTLTSRFKLDDQPVTVTTACHPEHDAIAVRIESAGIKTGKVSAYLELPVPDTRQFAPYVGSRCARFPAKVIKRSNNRLDLHRQLDEDQYDVAISWQPGLILHHADTRSAPPPQIAIVKAKYGATAGWLDVAGFLSDSLQHGNSEIIVSSTVFGSNPAPKDSKRLEVTYTVDGVEHSDRVDDLGIWTPNVPDSPNHFSMTGTGDSLEFQIAFSPTAITDDLATATETFLAAVKYWPQFWQSGGAIDLSASADPRWRELERRVVLSQYLMAVNEAGSLPPQESGLMNNGWFGKYHMEMYWWHAAHYALWNRWPLLDKSTNVYEKMLPSAEARAARQGFSGARWTKMTGPEFRNSTKATNVLLVWQQPHCMFFAELEYRARPTQATLKKWQTVLFESADFMASYATLNPRTEKYDLGPSLAPVSENTRYELTTNPTFELTYWRFGLRIAQAWRERLGLSRDSNWDKVLNNLAPAPIENGLYVTYDGVPDMWTKYNNGHPALIGAFGWLPGDRIDPATMQKTLDEVLANWKWEKVWGWDFPMLAMCAARLGHPEKAVDLLLTSDDHFSFDDAGLATGGPFPYFPSNGGLLYAVAMMAAGWDGSPQRANAPGFPTGPEWVVRWEGLSPAL
jgi:hypothetical protein